MSYVIDELCDCEFGKVVIVAEDSDHLCADCRRSRRLYGWCMAEAARNHKDYGDDWTPAQANALRERIEQPQRKHGANRRRGW